MATVFYTLLTLIAFAANSVLCRMALQSGSIDAASFTTVRLAAGAAMLLFVNGWAGASPESHDTVAHAAPVGRWAFVRDGSWLPAIVLFVYAVPFSFAYTTLPTGTGALILFGCVQVTMMGAAVRGGVRPHWLQWLGLGLAVAGLAYLVSPGISAPPLAGAGLMAIAGVAWGVYSLNGRGSANPLAQTTSNFVRAAPMVFAVSLAALPQFHVQRQGALLGMASGGLTSGLGYVAWYLALRGLTATRAAVIQLAVPVLAAAGGVLFLSEIVSARLIVAGMMVLGGIALALVGRERHSHDTGPTTSPTRQAPTP
jgi:drug/metabolite transporter (DMT)-like permease